MVPRPVVDKTRHSRAVFDGELEVHYGFLYLCPRTETPDLHETFHNQRNGLLGTAVPGALSIITGLHTGKVPLVVELHDGEPPLAGDFEDIVEGCLTLTTADPVLATFDDWASIDVPPGSYRVRLSATGMDVAHAADTRMDDAPLDHYLLQLWPHEDQADAPVEDRVVRVESDQAQYWHGTRAKELAEELPPIVAPSTPPGAPAGTTSQYGVILDAVAMVAGQPGSHRVRTPPEAVSVVIYEDMTDPDCEPFHTRVLPSLLHAIRSGHMTLEHRLVAYRGPQARTFAQVAACVIDAAGAQGLQGLHNMVGGPVGPAPEHRWRFASAVARRDISKDLDSQKFAPWVDAATNTAHNIGITDLPTITIAGQRLDPSTAHNPQAILDAIRIRLPGH